MGTNEFSIGVQKTGNTDNNTIDEYLKFKHLLEYFVAHLEYCSNKKNKNGQGYAQYIQPIKNFMTTGQGYQGDKIQNQISSWDNYRNGKICISVQYSPKGGYTTTASYLHWDKTWKNISAIWGNNNKIEKLRITDTPKRNVINSYSISDLELFNNDYSRISDHLKEFYNEYNQLIIEDNGMTQQETPYQKFISLLKANHNLIFTGAPGTGKTYLAKQIAEAMNAETAFVQFHPSYDYTDFVEGLRPIQSDDNGNIGFERKDGVFKEFCKRALEEVVIQNNNETIEKKEVLNINDAINKLKEECLNKIMTLNPKQKTPFQIWYSNEDNDTFHVKAIDGKKTNNCVNIGDIISIYTEGDNARNKNGNTPYNSSYIKKILSYLKENYNVPDFEKSGDDNGKTIITNNLLPLTNDNKFVFIIDEINRGEISKIFGELFFSIDPGYRGEKGLVQTQYQNLIEEGDAFKKGFFVPENVYIIGTMNDIDRSVECMDFAMRRRFAWQEITAAESAENMGLSDEIKKRMTRLNEAISNIEGLNSSYHIGGAYFLKLNNGEITAEDLWNNHLRGLLFEYLRGMPDTENKLAELETAFK